MYAPNSKTDHGITQFLPLAIEDGTSPQNPPETMTRILLSIMASHTRVGPFNQWNFGKSIPP